MRILDRGSVQIKKPFTTIRSSAKVTYKERFFYADKSETTSGEVEE